MTDLYGTASGERLSVQEDYQRVLGRGGNDTLIGGLYRSGNVLIGGVGSDSYMIEGGLDDTLIVLENGYDPLDNFYIPANLTINQALQVDGRHLLLNEVQTGRSILLLDWQRPENIIEMWQIQGSGNTHTWLTFDEFRSTVLTSRYYLGDYPLEIFGTAYATGLRREIDSHYAAAELAVTGERDPAYHMLVNGAIVTPFAADGSFGLEWQIAGRAEADVMLGTSGNDFINALAGNDGVDGAAGDDIIDGGSGSNFLSGGDGFDRFFVDGRGSNAATGQTVWSTVTDFSRAAGEDVTIWGWQEGTSRVLLTQIDGADGYQGATWHLDLTGDGAIDASVTLTGLTADQLTVSFGIVEGNGYLLLT